MSNDGSVMIVDDTHEILIVLAHVLGEAGYRVRPADTGELALAAVAAEPPELILLDVNLDGISGYEVCRRLKADPASRMIPIIFLSGLIEADERVEGLRLGACDYICKPFHREELLTRVGIHLEAYRMRRRVAEQMDALQRANARLVQEMSERRKASLALGRSEALLSATASAAHMGGWELDIRRQVVTWTDETARIHDRPIGYQPTLEEAISFYIPADQPTIAAAVQRAIQEGVGFDLELGFITTLGRLRRVRAVGVARRGQDGAVESLLGVFQDVTDLRVMETNLLQSQELFRRVFQASPLPSALSRLNDGVLLEINPAFATMLGRSQDACLGRTSIEVGIFPDSATRQVMADRLLAERSISAQEIVVQRADGEKLDILYYGVTCQIGNDQIIISKLIDVTERKRSEAAIRRLQEDRAKAMEAVVNSERDAAVGRLAARVAHEVNNPLAAMKAHLAPMRRRAGGLNEVVAGIDVLERQVDRIARLVRNLLDFERQRAPDRAPACIGEVISTVISLAEARARAEGKILQIDCAPDLPRCSVDVDQIQQVLLNLIGNALDAVAPGGHVVVSAGRTAEGVVVAIQDDGPGFQVSLDRLFEPFYTTKEKGCGLGLPLSQRICEAHGGWLRAANLAGGGAVFTCLLPVEGE